ncbi:glycosyltransferase [Butyrivibrio sp. XBB1001]|uniref:glycosyltransferase n=1 Tax=Butyrivibrio sp. XBB1001 TaxID=1280682 RepID=UPI0004122A32|nr:glycosyltransferase [Butyrivibrio sp. XBB1001]
MIEKLISIVLPVFNGGEYLEESIDSVLNQTYINWELIIVNDCSTDNTGEIIEKYKEKDSRIRVIKNEHNMKLPASLNIGFAEAKGEYFTWTSHDNRYRKNALSLLKDTLEKHREAALVYSGMNYMDENGKSLRIIGNFEYEELYRSNIVGACFLYKRDFADIVGKYDTDLFGAEDWDYWIRLSFKGNIIGIPEVLYDYRWHNKSLTATMKKLVDEQVVKTKTKHFGEICQIVKNDRRYVNRFILDYLAKGGDITDIRKSLSDYSIWKKYKKDMDNSEEIVIFGAGTMGAKAYNAYKNIYAYADNNKEREGEMFFDKKIISFEKMIDLKKNVVVAITGKGLEEVIEQLELSTFNMEFSILF